MKTAFIPAVILGVLWGACSERTRTPLSDFEHSACDEAALPVSAETPTWHRDIRPILARHCLGCHAEGGAAAVPLETYAQVCALGPVVGNHVSKRFMPPWYIDNSGACRTFQHANWVSDEDIGRIEEWLAGGLPVGAPVDAPDINVPVYPPIEATVTLDAGAAYTPDALSSNEWRCFVVDPGLVKDGFLTGYEIEPGSMPSVHHVSFYALDTSKAVETAEQLDAEDPGLGYACRHELVGVEEVRPVAGWLPGMPPVKFPEGTGIPVRAGQKFGFQVHYHTVEGAAPDRTQIHLRIADEVESAASIFIVGVPGFQLAPGEELIKVSGSTPVDDLVPSGVATIHAVMPHMHTLGASIRLQHREAGGGTESCLMDGFRWDFEGQRMYFYDDPVLFSSGDGGEFVLTCGFDTRERTETVVTGMHTEDEMCEVAFYVTR